MKILKNIRQKHILKLQINVIQMKDEERCQGDIWLIITGLINEVSLECFSLHGRSLAGPQFTWCAPGGWAQG